MMHRNDPWPEFVEKYLYSLMRSLVSFHGTVSGNHYVRVEGLLRRIVRGRERQLKRAVLDDVLYRWARTKHLGWTLEDAFNEAMVEVSDESRPPLSDEEETSVVRPVRAVGM